MQLGSPPSLPPSPHPPTPTLAEGEAIGNCILGSFRIYGSETDNNAFNDSIRQLFLSFNSLMDRPLEEAIKIKGAALKYLPGIINDVMLVFDPTELR
uniref:Dedicator of cytokinesis protein 5-like n=1 Tax=Callorhinchus milii TaxID=7868 RepID=A0A4W3GHV3_CALMI